MVWGLFGTPSYCDVGFGHDIYIYISGFTNTTPFLSGSNKNANVTNDTMGVKQTLGNSSTNICDS